MRHSALLVAFAALFCSSVSAQVNLNAGLVGYYPFHNGNAGDSSGKGNHGIVYFATAAADRNGTASRALAFNGQSSYIRIPSSATLSSGGKFSVCVQFKPTGFYSGPCHGNVLVARGDFSTPGSYNIQYSDYAYTSGQNCNIATPDVQHEQLRAMAGTASGPSLTAAASAPYLQLNQWYSAIAVQDSFKLSIYLNGALISTTPNPVANAVASTQDIFLGRLNNAQYPYWFNGVMDEVRIYNRDLNATEIAAYDTLGRIAPPSQAVAAVDGQNLLFSLSPNPAGQQLDVQLNDQFGIGAIGYVITNVAGQAVQQGALATGHAGLDISALPSGLYLLRLTGSNASAIGRFVKQ
jgi:hypothetical protein